MSKLTIKLKTLIVIIATTLFAFLPAASTYAIGQFAISPMFQQITLTPGETSPAILKSSTPATTLSTSATPFGSNHFP